MRLFIVLDCADAEELAGFWSAALGFQREPFEPPYLSLKDPDNRWPDLLLQQVPEPKTGKNRMHLDLQVPDVATETARLTALGATVVEPEHDDNGFRLAVLADPQGNEFCLVTAPSQGSATA